MFKKYFGELMNNKIFVLILIIILITALLFAVKNGTYQINPGPCTNCGNCVSHCPNDAIYYNTHIWNYQINQDLCDGCGNCVAWCPRDAIYFIPPQYIYGDVDGDENVSSYDAALTLQYSAGIISDWTEEQITSGDVNGDGNVSSYDAALILQYSAGIIDEFPVEGGK